MRRQLIVLATVCAAALTLSATSAPASSFRIAISIVNGGISWTGNADTLGFAAADEVAPVGTIPITTGGLQIYGAAMELNGDSTLGAPSVTFGSDVEAGATFDASVGSAFSVTGLTTAGAATLADSLTTSDAQARSGSTLTLGAPLPATPPTLQATDVTSSGPISHPRDVTIDGGGGTLSGTASGSFCCGLTMNGPGTLNCDDGAIEEGVVNEGGTATGGPSAPTAVSATPGDRQATVAFTPGAPGCFPISYTTRSQPTGAQDSGGAPPITVTPLLDLTPSSFMVTETDPIGSATSAASGAIMPISGPPSATIISPATGQTYTVGEHVATDFACVDPPGGPGITSCRDSDGATSPGQLNTLTPGTFTYTVTATNSEGQTGTASITYTVITPATPQPRPSNHFKVSDIHAGRDGRVTLRVTLPGAGRIDVVEAAGRTMLGRVSARVRRPGAVHLAIRLNRRQRRVLARARKLKVRLSVTYAPNGGTPRTERLGPITLRTR